MALFTRTNAAEMARRSQLARAAKAAAIENPAIPNATAELTAEVRRKQTLAQQIDKLDALIARAKSSDKVLRLIGAKAKLWELLYPKPGSLRPKAVRDNRAPVSPIAPLPIEPVPALVAPGSQQDHKTETAPAQVAA